MARTTPYFAIGSIGALRDPSNFSTRFNGRKFLSHLLTQDLPLDYLIEFLSFQWRLSRQDIFDPLPISHRMFLYFARRQIMDHFHGDVANTNQSNTCHPSASFIRFLTALSTMALLSCSLTLFFRCFSQCFDHSIIRVAVVVSQRRMWLGPSLGAPSGCSACWET
jgi:hypothetical protein